MRCCPDTDIDLNIFFSFCSLDTTFLEVLLNLKFRGRRTLLMAI